MEYVPADFDDEQIKRADDQLRPDPRRRRSAAGAQKRRRSCRRRSTTNFCEEASDWNADLIVVGSHRPVMSDYLLGSNAKTIVRHAQCSVLVVR